MGEKSYQAAVAGLLAVCAFLAGALASARGGSVARAETSGHAPGMIAVTGAVGSGVSALYVIDTEKKQLAVYNAMGGREVRFIAARRIKYDLELREFNDRTEPRASVLRLADAFRRDNPDEADKKGGPERK